MISKIKDVVNMEDLENWLKELLRQKQRNETEWFLNRPSLQLSRERELKELA
jgi:hypothetical protein